MRYFTSLKCQGKNEGMAEARHVLRVDGQRDVLLARLDAGLVQGKQAPGLPPQHVQPKALVVVLGVGLA